MKDAVNKLYGNRVRVRVCGICLQKNKILLIHHSGVGEKGSLWAPPGGGLDFGESAEKTLIREYKEETGLDIEVKEFLFTNEFLAPPLHAIELFFRIEIKGGIMIKGTDPEMSDQKQIIQDIRYWTFDEITSQDPLFFHEVLRTVKNLDELLQLRGFRR
jgi:8-oxo-dGTP diphosphatase